MCGGPYRHSLYKSELRWMVCCWASGARLLILDSTVRGHVRTEDGNMHFTDTPAPNLDASPQELPTPLRRGCRTATTLSTWGVQWKAFLKLQSG